MQRYFCNNLRRRDQVRETLTADGSGPRLNGLDYVEVSADQTTLNLHFIHSAPALTTDNLEILGGARIKNIQVTDVLSFAEQPNTLQIRVNQRGDFSTYRLRLVTSSVDSAPPTGITPPLDPQLAEISFSFKVDCPSDFDCPKPLSSSSPKCPPPSYPQPHIDYLAKDYASFRQLMLDRLSVTLPEWTERNPADIGVALVEVLAYAADQLSYYQDAAATEAYLGTARQRASVRRHARLLNYPMHEGCNARTWIALETEIDNLLVPKASLFFTRVTGEPNRLIPGSRAYQEVLRQRPVGFEAMHGLRTFVGHNQVSFYTWSDENCCLPKGATHATLMDNAENRLHLRPGDVIVLVETRSPRTGRKEDAAVTHRQAVRLTAVHPAATEAEDGSRMPGPVVTDPLTDQPVVEIRWHPQDALAFALRLSQEIDGALQADMAIARANILLADHGQTSDSPEITPNTVPEGIRYRPRLKDKNITYAAPFSATANATEDYQSAHAALHQDPRQALPVIELKQDNDTLWAPESTLLNSDRFDEKFVVEPDNTRRAILRFGDGVFGQAPAPLSRFEVTYRVGNGTAGNIGAEAIAHIVSAIEDITAVTNPIPGTGGTEPEPITQVKLDAPHAFRTQERAVTEADFATLALRHPEVQQARATRRWTGSWYTYFVTVDRKGGRAVDAAFERDFRTFLERFRLAGYDLEVDAPQFVPLDLRFVVCVQPGYFLGNVKAALLETFSNRDWPDGRRGFFHPDNFTFGQPVYLSAVVAAAMATPGVQWIETAGDRIRFQRWGHTANQELEKGEITFDRLEIARLDNDPNAPENGRIEFIMEGGQQ